MKKVWIFAVIIILIFSACKDGFLAPPLLPPSEGNQVKTATPENVMASHGEKRSITVSWDSVPSAALYYIYKADNPLDTFIRCAEMSSNFITFNNVPPGSTVYYRISYVLHDGTESKQSNFAVGTSLAQPVISDITDISEDKAAVTWYMENVSGSAYKNDLLYTIYCFSGDTEIAHIMLEASDLRENRAEFSGLNANTKYEYQVEAYLRTNQTASEKSVKMDAATARRFKPGPPINMKAARGTSAKEVEVTFELPDMVDVALGGDMYDPKPLYFTVSKRIYSESGNNVYQQVCPYFGVDAHDSALKIDSYSPGAPVTWVDKNIVRGEKYEYLIQSYVDRTNKIISSDSSKSTAEGWTISSGKVEYGDVKYELNANGSLFEKAELSVNFEFDPKGETYTYIVKAKVDPIRDGENDIDPSGPYIIKKDPVNNYENVKNYSLKMNNLNSKSSEENPGRGDYSVYIEVGQQVDGSFLEICKFEAVDIVQISELTQPIVVENFTVQDGYTNKFELMWDYYRNRKYIIEQSSDRISWTHVGSVNDNPTNEKNEEVTKGEGKYSLTGQPDTTRYIRIRAAQDIGGGKFKEGQWVTREASTLGIPELSLSSGASYSSITPVWKPAQRADAYKIRYWYTDDPAKIESFELKEPSLDATGNHRYSFNPKGYDDAKKSGKEIKIAVDALNEGLRKVVGGGEISTSSKEDVRTRLVGPSLLSTEVSKAASAQDITISWNSISGAGGYYVLRRQYNMQNTAELGNDSVVYYVPASTSSSVNITGKNLALDASKSKIDTATVKATASFANSRYTLTDKYLTDNEYDSPAYSSHTDFYRNQQNDMAQGMTYRYFVVPVIVRGTSPDPLEAIDFNWSNNSYTLKENDTVINYLSTGSDLVKDGLTIGFGQNVTATKGTYSSSATDGRKINNGIEIKWSAPPRLSDVSGFTTRYTVYRRETGSSTWTPIISDYASTSYVDTAAGVGQAYEYVIALSTFKPHESRRFVELCTALRDEKNRPNMSGYKLGMVRMDSVSRGADAAVNAQYGEVVKWFSAGISNNYNSGNENWGIDGYEVFVMNRNINANWHSTGTAGTMTDIPNQVSLSVTLTPNNTGSVNNTAGISRNLLFVLRDYKHFFKVRSFVLNGDERIYSPDPAYTYTNCLACNGSGSNHTANFTETDYVKWGARQVTDTEYAKIVTIYLAEAFRMSDYWALNTTWIAKASASGNHGGGGSFRHRHTSAGGTEMHIEYSNWKQNMQNRVGDWLCFLSIDGKIWASNTHSQWPTAYGRHVGTTSGLNQSNPTNDRRLKITGPADVPHLYSGEMHFGGDGTTDMTWTAGQVHLRYPTGATQRTITLRGQDSAMPFQSDKNHRVTYDAWK